MIKTDPKLQKVLAEIAERPKIPCAKFIREVIELHTRLPDTKAVGAQLSRDRMRIATDRSRIVGIKLICFKEVAETRRVDSRMRDYLYSKYANFLQQHRNKRARDAVINDALAPLTARIKPVMDVLEIVDVALGDFDSRGFAIRDTVAALHLGERE